MKEIIKYETFDKELHDTEEKAIDYCLSQAQQVLKGFLQRAGVTKPYLVAGELLLNADLVKGDLLLILKWLNNVNVIEEV